MLQHMAKRYKDQHKISRLQSSFFRKSLIIVLFITCLPTTFIGFTLYFIGVNRIETEVNKTHQLSVNQISKQLDAQLSQLEIRLAQWVFNPIFSEKLKTLNFGQEVDFTRDMLKSLLLMQESNPLIDEVSLYIDSNQTLISSSRGVNKLNQTQQNPHDAYLQLLQEKKNIFWTKTLPLQSITNSPSVPTDFKYSLVHKLPGDSSEKYGVFIVRINTAKLNTYFSELSDSSAPFLMDTNGDWLVGGRPPTSEASLLENTIHNEIMDRWPKQKEDTFLYGFRNTKYSISYHTFSRLGSEWIFTTSSDISNISKPVLLMSRLIISISVLGLITAICLSWFASKRIYQPIARLMGTVIKDKKDRGNVRGDELTFIEKEWQHLSRESHILQTKVEEQLPTLREGFMLQLVQGRLYYLDENELRARMSYYGWDTVGQQYTVIAVQLIGLTSEGGKFKEDDEQLVTFAAANIVDEITHLHLEQVYVINFQDLFVGIILALPTDTPGMTMKKELTKLSQEIITTLNHILKLQVTVCIGQLSNELTRIPTLMEEARHTLRFRKLLEANQIIDMDSLIISGDYTFRYPFEIEKELIHAIRLGQEEEAFHRAEEFIAELDRIAGVELFLQQAMMQLIGNVNNALLQAGFNVYSYHRGHNIMEELLQLRQSDEMLKWFKGNVISPYVMEMNETYHAHLTQSIEKVVRLVEEKYMTDLSLEECADMLGVHVTSLSKTFKQIKGINYVDYVTKVRIDTSKKLLLETDLKISEIAEKVGYQHSWFNRVFKKSEGVTPTQFREQQQ
ncbi:HTH-type transcriptional regulator YesS [Paenibacillus allorhizoplanae]|uniref:HTH-type transcriptional regulator YesS n=1 Tax=Paenibacillus allorhizoplanae TaxID=2905648 RepID=A0ABM9CNR5_9BACL|nr:helix-turn-helix domain-containing protein [Paenibacillus allorhizoplanae]CAH1217673.1 HTH-type transcriptional regulator YesS [Paenibacillus allorhizoplanae]